MSQLVINDMESQTPVVLHPPPMTDDEFFDYCQLYPNFRIERSADGEIIILPGTGLDTGRRNNEIARQLGNWAIQDRRGEAFDSNTQFLLRSGASRSPDASWIENSRIEKLTKEQKRKFPPICPEFVVELTSATDRVVQVKAKMVEWIENGTQLGWLLDPDNEIAYVYRPGQLPEALHRPERIEGEGPVAGFVLELARIWAKL
jgi:Uma2 family endonuclease